MIKWLTYCATIIIVITLLLRVWRYWDDRVLASTWKALAANAKQSPDLFDASQIETLPTAAQRFFKASIKNASPLHTVVEISMRGEFSLGDKNKPNYLPMTACQLLAPPYGFIWQVKAGKGMMQFTGSDAAFPGGSWTRFWLYGLLPVVRESGTYDHALSSFGRYMGEAVFWSPASLLPTDNVVWKEIDANSAQVTVTHADFALTIEITLDANGHLKQVWFNRWSNANDENMFRYQPFGGYLSDFKEFNGFLLPTTVSAGNHFGTSAYFPFFKASVESVQFVTHQTYERTCKING